MQLLKRAPNREITGLRFEILGLALLLVAAIWQTGLSDWFDRNDTELAYWTQENVNLALLDNQKNLASIAIQEDKKSQHEIWNEISDRTGDATVKAIKQRDERLAMQHTQAKVFKSVRFYMAIAGAFFIILGKYFVFVHKAETASKSSG